MSWWGRRSRTVLALVSAAGLILFVWLSVQVYRSKKDPENFRAWDGPYAWIVGPPAKALEEAARERMQAGLELLEDTSLPAPDRIRLYREELRRAEALLVRSLRAQPAQAHVLATLAAVRWELEPPLTSEAVQKHLDMIALASRMAPTYPEVQRQLGELLLKMGRRDEALGYLARTVELEPGTSREVILLLQSYLFGAGEMLEALPRGPLVLAYLEGPFVEESREADYLVLLEEEFARLPTDIHPALITRYGSTCLRLRQAEHLVERMTAMDGLAEAPAEAERLKQRARGHAAAGQLAEAIRDASASLALEPDVPTRSEYLGDVLLAAGDTEEAVSAYRDALGLLARAKAHANSRARLYRRIGQAEERGGHPDQAYDAYKRALDLNPGDLFAGQRIDAMERAAGFE